MLGFKAIVLQRAAFSFSIRPISVYKDHRNQQRTFLLHSQQSILEVKEVTKLAV